MKSKYQKSHKSASILNWWEEIEQKSISLSVQYKYMFTTDITDCYKSIYTHSIAWALMGKDNAKIKKGEKGYIGNIIDTYMQGMQYGQTNGIPQGSVLFDFIAENGIRVCRPIAISRIGKSKYYGV
ncbi:RNA-directed DNA polymerase [Prevotella intermedia]|uniref:RNA-directed DNA polymerase n=1 Tax=Prevotella intermedia TaxID=28131 RepID=UPI0020A5A7CD|nr:RNA-directed DNA polymerase [Prevotella intermedia]